jgi:hypothetical protein
MRWIWRVGWCNYRAVQIGRGAVGAAILVNHKTEKKMYDVLVQFGYWVYFPMNLPSRQLFALLLQVCVKKIRLARSDAASLLTKKSTEFSCGFLFVCCQFAPSSVNWRRKWKLQMALIARLQHPYIVEFRRYGFRRLVLREHAPVLTHSFDRATMFALWRDTVCECRVLACDDTVMTLIV